MNHFSKLVCVTCLAMVSQAASAYNYISAACGAIDYKGGQVAFNYASNLLTAEKADISTAFSRLTAFTGAAITTNDNGDSSFSRGNGQNEIYYDISHGTAQCWLIFNTEDCTVKEADIRFGNQPWVTGSASEQWPYGSVGRSIMATAVHEGGHCLGMAHENTLYNMMGSDWSHVTRNGVVTYYGPGEDLSDGLIDLHGKRSSTDAYRDVGITVMRYDVADGEYSDHKFGALRKPSGYAFNVSGSYEGQDVYKVVAGDTVSMELTLENNGEKDTESPHIGFYLSTNSLISESDTLIATNNSYLLGRNSPYETTQSVTIPVATVPGNYFLGAFIDHDKLINETTSANNVAYYPIKVLPPPPDLTVPFFSVSDTTLLPGQAFTAYAIVRNDGLGPSDATTLLYMRSNDSVINSRDIVIGSEVTPVLNAGAVWADNDPNNAPLFAGTSWIGACVAVVINESNTSNQCSTGSQVTVAAQPPAVTTAAATAVNILAAVANGTVNANGAATQVFFDYGTDNLFGNTVSYGSVNAGLNPTDVSAPVTGLICNTTYQVRTRAVNSAGTTLGNVQEFTTPICPGCN